MAAVPDPRLPQVVLQPHGEFIGVLPQLPQVEEAFDARLAPELP